MRYHRKITIAVMILVIMAFFFSSRHYIFNEKNNYGGLVFISTTLKVWHEKSPADYNFCPVLTYTNNGDKFVTYYKRLEDPEGNNYFVSQPPFSEILAFYLISLLNLNFDPYSLKIINLLVLAIGSVLVYLIVNMITKKKLMEFSIAALLAMICYLFIPVNDYSAAAAYAPELLFWLMSILFYLVIALKKPDRIRYFILFGLSVFLVTYTDWIGLFFSCSVLFYCILHRKVKLFRKIFIYALIFTGLSLLLTYLQFSSLNGTSAMLHAMKLRFLGRSGLFGTNLSEMGVTIFSISSLIMFLKNLNLALIGFGYILILFTGIFLYTKNKNHEESRVVKIIFFPTLLPVIAHFIILFNSNAIHHFYMAKISVAVSILLGVMFNFSNQVHLFSIKKAVMFSIVILCAVISCFMTYKYYPLEADLSIPEKQGTFIHDNALPEEAVFISKDTTKEYFVDYLLTYLSDRNLRYADGEKDALNITQQLGKTKGVYFKLNDDTSLCMITHFQITDNNLPK